MSDVTGTAATGDPLSVLQCGDLSGTGTGEFATPDDGPPKLKLTLQPVTVTYG